MAVESLQGRHTLNGALAVTLAMLLRFIDRRFIIINITIIIYYYIWLLTNCQTDVEF